MDNDKIGFYLLVIGSVLVIGIYLLGFSQYVHNLPHMRDDAYFFLRDFRVLFLESDSFLDMIKFLFKGGVRPYPKILGRIVQILEYKFFGEISFKFLFYTGHLLLVGSLYYLVGFIKDRHRWLIIVVTCLIALHLRTNMWAVCLYGYHAHVFFLLGFFYYLNRSNYPLSGIFLFFSFFSSLDDIFIGFVIVLFFVFKLFFKDWTRVESKGLFILTTTFILVSYIKENVTFQGRRKTSNTIKIEDTVDVLGFLEKTFDNIGLIIPQKLRQEV